MPATATVTPRRGTPRDWPNSATASALPGKTCDAATRRHGDAAMNHSFAASPCRRVAVSPSDYAIRTDARSHHLFAGSADGGGGLLLHRRLDSNGDYHCGDGLRRADVRP